MDVATHPQRTIRPTLLMTDIVGSTVKWELFPSEMAECLRLHDSRAQAIVEIHRGKLIKERGEGDSLFCIFEDPNEAALAALDFLDIPAGLPHREKLEIQIRAGIHLGPVNVWESDLYGPTINRCARIRETAPGRTIVMSESARTEIKESEKIALRCLGEHRLRDLSRPEILWQVFRPEDPPEIPRLKSLSVLRNNLPSQLTAFVGCEEFVAEITDAVSRNRLVTIAGPGGCGKTRLALQTAARNIDTFDLGVWFVDLTEINEPSHVPFHVADSLGIKILSDKNFDTELIQAVNNLDKILLVVDNAEHVLESVTATVNLLLRNCSNLHFLVTSRQPLHIDGEVVFRSPTLGLPTISDDLTPQEAMRSEAVQLFVNRAATKLPSFQLRDTNVRAVAEIVVRLDGIPLAIEQAASAIRHMSPQQIHQRLQDRFRFLKKDSDFGQTRHRTLLTTIEWSFNMMDPDEQKLLSRLSVFAGSFSLEAAETVCSDEHLSPDDILFILQSLVDKSMVNVIHYDDDARYKLLDTIAQYAAEQLAEGLEVLYERLFEWSLIRAREADSEISGPNQRLLMRTLGEERPSFRRVLDWGFVSKRPDVAEIVLGLRKYWIRGGHLIEGRVYLERTLHLRDRLEEHPLAKLLNALGAFAYRQGDFSTAKRSYIESRELWQKLCEPGEEAAVLGNLGILEGEAQNHAEATALYRESLRLAAISGRKDVERLALLNLAMNHIDLAEFSEAVPVLNQALLLAKADGDEGRLATIGAALADVLIRLGEYSEASRHLSRAFRIWRDLRDPFPTAEALLDGALLALQNDQPELAATFYAGFQKLMETSNHTPSVRATAKSEAVVVSLQFRFPSSELRELLVAARRTSLDEIVKLAHAFCLELSLDQEEFSPIRLPY